MSAQDQRDRVWDIIEAVGVGMLTTRFTGGLRARPLQPRPDRAAGIIWFLTDARSAKDDEIAASPDIGLVVIDADDKAYLSITGRAQIVRDIATARRFWKETDAMWWSGPDDPNLCLLKVELVTAELWDGPAGELRGRHVRVRQGAAHGRRAQSGREPQGNGADVSAGGRALVDRPEPRRSDGRSVPNRVRNAANFAEVGNVNGRV